MSEKHVSVWNSLAVAILAILLVLGGLAVGFLGLLSLNGGTILLGVVMFFAGLFIGGANKLLFRARTTQLTIDTKEGVRDRFRERTLQMKYCRYCGTANKGDADFCEKCGKKIS